MVVLITKHYHSQCLHLSRWTYYLNSSVQVNRSIAAALKRIVRLFQFTFS